MQTALDLSTEPYFGILCRTFRRWRSSAGRNPTAMPVPEATPSMLAALTTELVCAYVGGNTLPATDMPPLIETVYRALQHLAEGEKTTSNLPRPAIPIRKSITPDYIVCLEDGRKLKMLKRYLRARYRMSPEEYRSRWSLPPDYPMIAPNYAAERSETAKRSGLGRRPRAGSRRRL